MSLDCSKLENLKERGGKTTARCPACAESGADNKGEHLFMAPDGAYSCITHPGDKAHSKRIFELAGNGSDTSNTAPPIRRLTASAAYVVTSPGWIIKSIPDFVIEDGVRARFVRAYPYHDALGKEIYQVARFEMPPGSKKTKTFRQFAVVDNGFRPSMGGVPVVPYQLPMIARADSVYITEGEKDADNLLGLGYVATCNPGGAGKWQSEWSPYFHGKRVFIFPDNDDPGKDHADRIEACLQGVAKSIKRVSIPAPAKDISELLSGLSDTEAKAAVEDLINAGGNDPYDSCDWVDFSAEQEVAPDPQELIRGLLHKGSKAVLANSSKGKKTWSLLDMAVSVASGRSWWGWETSQGPVVFVNMELTKKQLYKRLRFLLMTRGISLSKGQLHVINLRGHVANAQKTIVRIQKSSPTGVALIVLDPIYKFNAGRDENSAGDIAEMLNMLESLAVSTGAAVVYAAHYSKGNQSAKESIDRISGSGVYARDADTLVMMTAHEAPECFTIEPTLRNFPPVEPFVVRWTYPLMDRVNDLDPTKLKKPPGGFERKYSVTQLVEVLGGESLSFGRIVAKAEDAFRMSRATVDRLLKEGQAAGAIEKLNLFYRAVSRVSRP